MVSFWRVQAGRAFCCWERGLLLIITVPLNRYLAILTVMEAVGLPNVLPVFDLSSKVFPSKEKDVGKQA